MSVDGWGVVAAVVVGGLAYLGVVQGIRSGRQQSAVSDARERWWTALTWVWDNRAVLERVSAVQALDALRESAQTSTQAVMLRTVAVNVLRPDPPGIRPSARPEEHPDEHSAERPDEGGEPADVTLLLERIGTAAAALEATGL